MDESKLKAKIAKLFKRHGANIDTTVLQEALGSDVTIAGTTLHYNHYNRQKI